MLSVQLQQIYKTINYAHSVLYNVKLQYFGKCQRCCCVAELAMDRLLLLQAAFEK